MIDFDTYIKMGEPGGKERAEAWKLRLVCRPWMDSRLLST